MSHGVERKAAMAPRGVVPKIIRHPGMGKLMNRKCGEEHNDS